MKEVYFEFDPSMRIIEMLPECLEHLPFLELNDDEPYSGKFKRLKSLVLWDNRFDLFHFLKSSTIFSNFSHFFKSLTIF